MMKRLKWGVFVVLMAVLALGVLTFQALNPELVTVRTLIGDLPEIRLGDALLWSIVAGFFMGLAIGGAFWQLKVIENRWLRHKLKSTESPS